MLDGGVPIANTGVGGAYALGDLSVDLTSSSVRSVQTVKFRARTPQEMDLLLKTQLRFKSIHQHSLELVKSQSQLLMD